MQLAVGIFDYPPAIGNASALAFVQAQVEVEIAQDCSHEIEAFKIRVLPLELLEPRLVENMAKQARERHRQSAMAVLEVGVTLLK